MSNPMTTNKMEQVNQIWLEYTNDVACATNAYEKQLAWETYREKLCKLDIPLNTMLLRSETLSLTNRKLL